MSNIFKVKLRKFESKCIMANRMKKKTQFFILKITKTESDQIKEDSKIGNKSIDNQFTNAKKKAQQKQGFSLARFLNTSISKTKIRDKFLQHLQQQRPSGSVSENLALEI